MTTLYEKRGRRYVPVAEREQYDARSHGWWLLHVAPGRQSWAMVEPNRAAVEAAMRIAENAMVAAMQRACSIEDRAARGMTKDPDRNARWMKAWRAWEKAAGEELPQVFRGVSMVDVVRAGLDALRKEMP